ncbi:hypothetical protein Rsub_00799 [Raphidocelis subcapitata]|uniref:Uncharacterized protein n=1 Tax=Raphidocelis subcapitata TaxID=307507 RepID=A0A2V0NT33_9CHLO|nr:hypothetical protein Rsub_00799 [Raphidocelis subcapitata]|eukprot:GBF88087.1 hypothetical protein Rsub_00799 [Raphidocelis subcapitata]
MQPEGHPDAMPAAAAVPAGAVPADLGPALATIELALKADKKKFIGFTEAGAIKSAAQLLAQGLASPDAAVARRAAAATASFALRGGRCTAEAAGAAMPALARLVAGGDAAASCAALTAAHAVLIVADRGVFRDAARAFAAAGGGAGEVVAAVRRGGALGQELPFLTRLLEGCGGDFAAGVADSGLPARLLALAAAAGDGPWGRDDARFDACGDALECLEALLDKRPAAAAQLGAPPGGADPLRALGSVVARGGWGCGSCCVNELQAVQAAAAVVARVAESGPDAARAAAACGPLLTALTAAAARAVLDAGFHALQTISATAGAEGKAAVVATAAAALASAPDAAACNRLRGWLSGPAMGVDPAAVSALVGIASEAAALRARVEELEAIPFNTRAAIVDLAQCVRGKRQRREAFTPF